jgi:hypothetical protein
MRTQTFPPLFHCMVLAVCFVTLCLLGLVLPDEAWHWGYAQALFFVAISASTGAIGWHSVLALSTDN